MCFGRRGGSELAAADTVHLLQERRGLVFCVEDRIILCADYDDRIHSANDLTTTTCAQQPYNNRLPFHLCRGASLPADAQGEESYRISFLICLSIDMLVIFAMDVLC